MNTQRRPMNTQRRPTNAKIADKILMGVFRSVNCYYCVVKSLVCIHRRKVTYEDTKET